MAKLEPKIQQTKQEPTSPVVLIDNAPAATLAQALKNAERQVREANKRA